MTTDDIDLLRAYTDQRSEDAFRTLVERHAAMVQGAARRLVRNEMVAQDVTQAVFILLARKANRLPSGVVLAGWLYQTTRWVASQALRTERRRQLHLERLVTMQESPDAISSSQPNPDSSELPPHLEQAMARLTQEDRNAVLLRYFENQDFAEVARALGLSEAAAKMRVGRALEKLRATLHRSGVVMSIGALGTALATHAAPALPPGAAANLATAALSPASASITSTTLLKSLMTWNKIKTLAAAALIALLLAVGVAWHFANKPAPQKTQAGLATFAPMAGQWEGTFSSGETPGSKIPPVPASLTITTADNGQKCDIVMRVGPPGPRDQVYHFSHALLANGRRLFSTHDRQIPRTDGDGVIVDSFQDAATGEWRATFQQTFENNRGQMEGSWQRTGDQLDISSHDEYHSPSGTNHVFSELKLRRHTGSATPK